MTRRKFLPTLAATIVALPLAGCEDPHEPYPDGYELVRICKDTSAVGQVNGRLFIRRYIAGFAKVQYFAAGKSAAEACPGDTPMTIGSLLCEGRLPEVRRWKTTVGQGAHSAPAPVSFSPCSPTAVQPHQRALPMLLPSPPVEG